jgi:hypothetical protein
MCAYTHQQLLGRLPLCHCSFCLQIKSGSLSRLTELPNERNGTQTSRRKLALRRLSQTEQLIVELVLNQYIHISP